MTKTNVPGQVSNSKASRVAELIRGYFGPVTLFAGIVFCVLALRRMLVSQTVAIHFSPALLGMAILGGAVSTIAAAAAWREMLFAFSGQRIPFPEALAQLGLVLIGKYVPGKISGIAARVLANKHVCPARTVVTATLFEWLGALAAAALVGVCAYIAKESLHLTLIVALAVAPIWWSSPLLVEWSLGRWKKLAHFSGAVQVNVGAVRLALTLQVLQWFGLIALIIAVARMVIGDNSAMDLLRVAGAYGIAVVVGQLIILFPGGIGPREGVFIWLASALVGTTGAVALALALRIATIGLDLVAALAYVVRHLGAGKTTGSS